jgi:hypothetical protein
MAAKSRTVTKSRPVGARTNNADAERCTLCGYRSDGSFADRMRHLRGSHPGYARGLLLRLVAPLMFAGLVVLLAVAQAPTWGYFVALALMVGFVAVGVMATRHDATRTRARPNIRQLLGSGGLRFVIFGAAAVIMVMLTFH